MALFPKYVPCSIGPPTCKRKKIRRVFSECDDCIQKGLPFDYYHSNKKQTGRPPIIEFGSVEEGIIADWVEADMGSRMTTKMVNEHRLCIGKPPVSKNVVLCHIKRMKPIISTIKKKITRQQ